MRYVYSGVKCSMECLDTRFRLSSLLCGTKTGTESLNGIICDVAWILDNTFCLIPSRDFKMVVLIDGLTDRQTDRQQKKTEPSSILFILRYGTKNSQIQIALKPKTYISTYRSVWRSLLSDY